jgi:hypothetical protein
MIIKQRQVAYITSSISTPRDKSIQCAKSDLYYITMLQISNLLIINNVPASLLQIGVTSALIYTR